MGPRRKRRGELSPQAVYYDPRYKRHFYAGLLPPLPAGAVPGLQPQQPPVPIPSVELVPTRRTRRPSILVTGGDRKARREDGEERRISWEDDDGDVSDEDQPRGSSNRFGCSFVACAASVVALLVSLLAFAATLWVSGSIEGAFRESATTTVDDASSTTALTEAMTATDYARRAHAQLDKGAQPPPALAHDAELVRTPRNTSRTTTKDDNSTGDTKEHARTKTTTTRKHAPRTSLRTRRVRRTNNRTTRIG
ncbi:hypothetical protein V5799_026234 [Amblyomma americanum]|uniref:Uncharacterized protein n=1 Tax=Amblyomma americanum TaxID=6943 RepID=A0AAQ4DJ55_AMBAM